mgnify:FL=1
MQKTELVHNIKEKTGLSDSEVYLVLNAMLDEIVNSVKNGEAVQITGFGKFELSERSERNGINPMTKEKIIVPASKSMKFKPANHVKKQINEN